MWQSLVKPALLVITPQLAWMNASYAPRAMSVLETLHPPPPSIQWKIMVTFAQQAFIVKRALSHPHLVQRALITTRKEAQMYRCASSALLEHMAILLALLLARSAVVHPGLKKERIAANALDWIESTWRILSPAFANQALSQQINHPQIAIVALTVTLRSIKDAQGLKRQISMETARAPLIAAKNAIMGREPSRADLEFASAIAQWVSTISVTRHAGPKLRRFLILLMEKSRYMTRSLSPQLLSTRKYSLSLTIPLAWTTPWVSSSALKPTSLSANSSL